MTKKPADNPQANATWQEIRSSLLPKGRVKSPRKQRRNQGSGRWAGSPGPWKQGRT